MKQISLVTATNESFSLYSHWYNGYYTLTPVYFEDNGKRNFIANTEHPDSEDPNIKWYAQQLAENDGKYFCIYCYKKDLLEFLDIVMKGKNTFTRDTSFDSYGDFVDFGGNLNESSCAFNFRIYDMEMFESLKKRLPKVKVRDMGNFNEKRNGKQ